MHAKVQDGQQNITSQTHIDNLKAYFVISSNDIPKISTPNTPPNYTLIHSFQVAINENVIALPAPNIHLGHASLTMKKVHFTTANSGTYTYPISPGDIPRKPTATGGIITRSAIEAAVGSVGTIKTAPIIDLFEVEEKMRQFVQDQ